MAYQAGCKEKQLKQLKQLLQAAEGSVFSSENQLSVNENLIGFQQKVAVRDYQQMLPYINKILRGEKNVLTREKLLYLAKSSGTTSGAKYLPLTQSGVRAQINAARDTLFTYIFQSGKWNVLLHKMIFLQGSPALEKNAGIETGRLSGIVYHHVPKYMQLNRLPSYQSNCIENWEEKLTAVCNECLQHQLSVIGGIPPWLVMFFERLIELSGKKNLTEIFPKLQLIISGGVNFEPYEARINELIGKKIDIIETYPASEGFIAYQNDVNDKSLLLNLDAHIFYEFIPAEKAVKGDFSIRLPLWEVEAGKNYALVLTTSSGLWAYLIGDTVQITSVYPYKLRVSGRIAHFINAFGEHVIQQEVENCIQQLSAKYQVLVNEFTVAAKVADKKNESCYEWYLEADLSKQPLAEMQAFLDDCLAKQNVYYHDLIKGNIIAESKIIAIKTGGFKLLAEKNEKLGGQNKVVHLSNDRQLAEELSKYRA